MTNIRDVNMRIETTQDWKYAKAIKTLSFKPGLRQYREPSKVINYLQSEKYLYLIYNLDSNFLQGTSNARKNFGHLGTMMLRVEKNSSEYKQFFKTTLTNPASIISDDFIKEKSYVRYFNFEKHDYETITYDQAEELINRDPRNKKCLYYHVKLPILKLTTKTSK